MHENRGIERLYRRPGRRGLRANRSRRRAVAAGVCACAIVAASAHVAGAQPRDDALHLEEPTGGIYIPAGALSGEHDAFAVSLNPAGLRFLSGTNLGAAVDMADDDTASQSGPGLGFFGAYGLGQSSGVGAGLEFLRPSALTLSPAPGTPARLTLAYATSVGRRIGVGAAWRRFFDEDGSTTDGLSTWDVGLSLRLGARWAAGAVVRDLTSPQVPSTGGAGGARDTIERRYEAELTARPLATDRLELAIGGRIGEKTADVDGWARLSLRVARGLYLKGEVTSRELRLVDVSTADELSERELRATAGIEISFGGVGVAGFGTGVRDAAGGNRLSGATALARISTEAVPSILGRSDHIERVEITGALSQRAVTRHLLALRAMARDPSVVAVFVQIEDLAGGWATVEELRDELLALREAGKRVFAYLVSGTTREYYLATAADKIYVDPAGGLRLSGMSATLMYFKGVFDKLGVSAQFVKIDEYKSAPEAYTRAGPTETALHMRRELYDGIFEHVVAQIAKARGLDEAVVTRLIDGGPYTAGELGKDTRLVDAVGMPDQIVKQVFQELGGAYPLGQAPRERAERWEYPAVAIIYVEGDIVGGKSQTVPLLGRVLVGGETIAQAIATARADSRVKAIVLRIDSPGGSALASELMAREVFRTRGVKPIVCSMGDLAASGGYFAAAGCDRIFASPTTITGSIGIFFGKFDVSALASRLGLTWQVYKRGERADMESMFRPFTLEERALVRDKMRYLYDRFVTAVSEGRGMTSEAVDAVGRGHVWSGSVARSKQLVDELGGLSAAIRYAKAQAGLGDGDRVRIVELPVIERSFLSRLLGLPFLRGAAAAGDGDGDARVTPSLLSLPGVEALLRSLPASLWVEPDQAQARLPFEVVWE